MAKQLNVNLAFTADTGKAKAQLQDLQNQLTNLVNTPVSNFGNSMSQDIQKAIVSAAELKSHLQNAMNIKTGTLDFTKLNDSISKSGKNLESYASSLKSLGPSGESAFMALTKAVSSAEIPIRRSNAALQEMWVTLKNTARWQISSSILHGFMGSVQAAYGYAQDLNESLNNIRIVTGQNADQMAAFAEKANKAAKALSTTTTEYTNASLIYYQQGLNDQQVQERTDITIKMAQASGQSAEIVSDQLTALWNNFYDGSQSLEHFADVLTKLGAETASSSDEISAGLEKFAAIGDMIGLSYDNAAAALATVTAQTRQSAEVVGTAFKTIFARIQGLSLGETLDDGTDLNKYSDALNKVGISIKDQNGELKDMDDILAEMGAKWTSLSKDQQVALAQTVAGVRQYNQLVALMDNFDFYEKNLASAKNSSGALQEQADIYAESWDAASKRVKAATEGIYQSLLKDDFFIDLLNGFEKFLTLIEHVTESMGGMQGALSAISAIVFKVFSKEIAQNLNNMAYSMKMMTESGQQEVQDEKSTFMRSAAQMISETGDYDTNAQITAAKGYEKQLELQDMLIQKSEQMNESEIQTAQYLLDARQKQLDLAIQAAQKLDEAENQVSDAYMDVYGDMAEVAWDAGDSVIDPEILNTFQTLNAEMKAAETTIGELDFQFESLRGSTEITDVSIDEMIQSLRDAAIQAGIADSSVEDFEATLEGLDGRQKINKISEQLGIVKGKLKEVSKTSQKKMVEETGAAAENVSRLANGYQIQAKASKKSKQATDEATAAYERAKEVMDKARGAQIGWADIMVKTMQSVSQLSLAFSSLGSIVDTVKNPDIDGWEKFLNISTSLTMAIPALMGGIKGLTTVNAQMVAIQNAASAANASLVATHGAVNAAQIIRIATTKGLTQAERLEQIQQVSGLSGKAAEQALELGLAASKGKHTVATIAQTIANKAETTSIWGKVAAKIAELAVSAPLLVVTLALAAAIATVVAVVWIVVKAFKAWQASTPEGQLDALKDKAEKSAEAFNRVQESVNATKEAIEGLKSSYDTIDNLTKGTNEWYEAVTDVNAEVMKLMEQYPQLLANQVYTTEDGILKITEEGLKNIETENRMRLQAAASTNTINQIAVAEKEVDNSYRDFKNVANDDDWYGLGQFGLTTSDMGKALQDYYDSEGVGETLFTEEGAKALMDGIIKAIGNSPEMYGEEQYEGFYNAVMANADLIRENSAKKSNIKVMQDSLLQQRISAIGSTRDLEEVKELMGQDVYENIKASSRQKVETTFGDWNDHINYKKGGTYTTDEEWSMIEDFMKLQGDDTEYVAQRNGKMVLEVNGEEIEYSKDEVYDALAELYSGPELESKMEAKLKETLSKTLDTSTRDLNLEELVELDNLRDSISDGLMGTDYENQSDEVFKAVANTYGTDSTGIEQLQIDTQYVDMSSEAFVRQALALQQGKIEATEFTAAVRELNAEGQLMAMGDYFTKAAESMGLDEEVAVEMQNYAEHLRSIAKDSDILADSLAEDADSAADLSVEIHRMNKGIEDLAEGFEDWKDILKNSSKESAEYAKAMKSTKSALSDVLDVEEDLISSDFVEEHLDEIEKAAEGDAEAIDFLRSQMDEEIIANITLGQSDEFIAKIQAIDEEIKNNIPENIEVGAIINDGAFYEAAAKMVEEAGMTADEANAYFAGMGYEPVYNTEEIDNSAEVPNSLTKTSVESIGWEEADVDLGLFGTHQIKLPAVTTRTESIPEDPSNAPGVTRLTSFSGDGKAPPIAGLRKKATGSQNNYSKQNSGGQSPGKNSSGGSKGSKPKKVNKSDIVERYKEITDTLDDVKDAYEDAGKASDRLYGANKIAAMKKQNAILLQEIDLLEEKKKQALDFLEIDKQALEDAANKAGVGVLFDDNGNISNYTAIMESLFNQLKAATDAAGAEIDDAEQEAIDAIQQKIDDLKSAIVQYDDTQTTIQEIDNSLEDTFDNWQQGNYDIIDYEMSLREDLLDREEKIIETQIKILGDSFYKMFEVASQYMQKLPLFEDGFANSKTTLSDAESAYANNEINQDQYISLLQSTQDSIQGNIDSMLELDEIMRNYYSETLEAGQDELDKYTDQLEHMGEVLDHYRTLLNLTGRSKDYKTIGAILESSLNNSKNLYEIAKENYEDLDARTQRIKKQLEDDSLSEKEREMLEGELATLLTLTAEAESEMYSHLEVIGDTAAEIFANTMAQVRKDFEASLSDSWESFEELNTQIDRLTTAQEEYLTRTNQLYETNKLIRQATLDMNKIENSQAKEKYKNYIKYIEQLQNEDELSKAELEIAQAKYDLLQAEIALQDAQNAKSQVRMIQDSEGNWGYVYTADQNKIAEAQQNYADAQNNLYNISLEGVKNYQSMISSAMQSAYDEQEAITQAWQNGEIESWDEYQRRLEESRTYWYSYMEDLYEEYGVYENSMLESSAEGYLDYTTANIGSIESFKKAYSDSMAAQTAAATTWKEDTDLITDEVGEDYTETKEKVDEVTKASDDLTKTIKDTVMPAIWEECDAVEELTNTWADQRDEVYDLIEAYQELTREIQAAMQAAAIAESKSNTTTSAPSLSTTSTSESETPSSSAEPSVSVGGQVTVKSSATNFAKDGGNGTKMKSYVPGNDFTVKQVSGDMILIGDPDGPNYTATGITGWVKKSDLVGFATGGYTGEWGPEGRLAVLHQKELVLNADQTERFFNLANRLTDISSKIDQNALSSTQGLSSLLSQMLINSGGQTLEQRVHIEASFPNVSDKTQIEEAFGNLINLASQYANRKF